VSTTPDIPAGFEPVQRIQPHTFSGLAGPFYARREGNAYSLGLRIDGRHLNSRGTCHGGLLATMADIALGYACVTANGEGKNFVTIDLSVEYLEAARAGDWLHSEVRVLNAGTRTASATGHLCVGEVKIARISANFRMARTRPPEPSRG
jgi:uncharacterized protein (TIGR00369 family)